MSAQAESCTHEQCQRCAARSHHRPLLAAASEVPPGCPNRLPHEVSAARALRTGHEALSRTPAARQVLAALPAGGGTRAIAALLRRGDLVLCVPRARAPVRASVILRRPAPLEELPRPVAAPAVTTWIEVQLVDLDCEPVAGQRYRITMPDGAVREGRLNYRGRVRFDDIETPGECQIEFPDLDMEAWVGDVRCPEPPPRRLPWVEFELVDLEGEPVAGQRYRVTLPDGTVREGFFGRDGRLRYEGIPEGPCTIELPDLDAEAWEAIPNAQTA